MSPMMEAAIMADHFDTIQKLPEGVAGVPNWRCVPGYQVYGCGQPTLAGFGEALSVLCGGNKAAPIIWINMRQEPSLYLNGSPVCARPCNKIGEYAELGNVTAQQLEKDEEELLGVVEERAQEAGGKVNYQDVHKAQLEVECKELISLGTAIQELQKTYTGLRHIRVPVCNSGSPNPADFDAMIAAMTGTKFSAPVVVNCQAGLSRATTGQVAACLFREMQVGSSFSGLVNTVPGLNLDLLNMDTYKMDMEKDHLFRGEFDVVKQLLSEFPNFSTAKNRADKLIDLCGPPKTGGTGIKQLRENIAESKLSYEIMDDAAQTFLKAKIQDNITKYFMLIVYSDYIGQAGKDVAKDTPEEDIKLSKSFAAYMEEHANLETMIQKGKGKLKWERDIPKDIEDKLEKLAAGDFKANTGEIIHDILGAANKVFKDMSDVGDHKKRAKYRFSSKTLMNILPAQFLGPIEKMIDDGKIALDFYDILGEVAKL